MNNDPDQVAKDLIEQFGLEQVSVRASQSAFEAQEAGQLYELSVWRDVRRAIYEKQAAGSRNEGKS